MAHRLLLTALALPFFFAAIARAQPWTTEAVSVETGLLWQARHSTPLSYRLIPTQLSWRSREVLGHEFADGTRLVVRNRFTLLGTYIQQGPESHYLALDGSPSVEWWDKAGTWCAYGGAGGGLGGLDSQGVKGAQGQDFTFNWFARGGIEHVVGKNLRFSVGIMFQHMSNGGQTKPNPGIDAVGFNFGFSRSY